MPKYCAREFNDLQWPDRGELWWRGDFAPPAPWETYLSARRAQEHRLGLHAGAATWNAS